MGGRGSGSGIARRRLRDEEPEQFDSFPDEAETRTTYKGDGVEQEKWFDENSNVDAIISQLSDDEIETFQGWARGNFMNGEQYKGWDNMRPIFREYTQVYDDVLDRSVITKGLSVVRLTTAEIFFGEGNRNASLSDLQGLEGQTILSKGNLSTAAASQGLTIGDSSKRHEIRINIPAGSKGAGMWIGDTRINAWGNRQREFMMNRDILLKVGKTTYDSNRNVYITEVTYTGRTPHDYGNTGRIKFD